MNILCLVDAFFPDHAGGISKSLLPEVIGLSENGHDVTVISRRFKKDTPNHEKTSFGYNFYRYYSPLKSSFFYKLYPLFTLLTLPRLINLLHKEKSFDIAYIHNPFQLWVIKKKCPDIPCIYVYHASVYGEIKLDISRGKYGKLTYIAKFVNFFFQRWEYSALKKADKIMVRSQFMKNDMDLFYPNVNKAKIVYVPLSVDTQHFEFTQTPSIVRKKIGLPEDKFLILTVRRLVARMGIENLITAMITVKELNPNVLLIIGGTGYLEDELREMIKIYNLENNVRFTGFIPEDDLPLYYQSADLFVLPTLAYEGFGLVTIESLSSGTPVVATPVGANPEILNPLGLTYLFKDNTPIAIAEGLNYWIKRGVDIEIRNKSRSYCCENFSKQKIVHMIEEIFSKMLK
jgi:glycosyltransferase involved in cell wall biosynthesis